MKFSCIIPCYNQAEYVAEAIDSALSQTIPCEVIVVNDGSTDRSLDVIKTYEGRIKIINQVNKGLPSARNTGIMNSSGDYILPLDADDQLMENCIEVMTFYAKENGADVIAPSFKTFGLHNAEMLLGGIPTIEDFKEANRLGYFSAIKRSVLLEIGGYNPKMVFGWEDYDLWIDLFKRGHSLCIVHEILVLYRTKEVSMITEANKHAGELRAQMVKNHPEVYG